MTPLPLPNNCHLLSITFLATAKDESYAFALHKYSNSCTQELVPHSSCAVKLNQRNQVPKSLPTASAGTSSTSTCTPAASAAQPWPPPATSATKQLVSHLLYHVLCSKLSLCSYLIRNMVSEHSDSICLPSTISLIL